MYQSTFLSNKLNFEKKLTDRPSPFVYYIVLALRSFLTHTLSDLIDSESEMFSPKFILFGFNVLYSKVTMYGEKRKTFCVHTRHCSVFHLVNQSSRKLFETK
jgi:hypothetical protein